MDPTRHQTEDPRRRAFGTSPIWLLAFLALSTFTVEAGIMALLHAVGHLHVWL